MEVSYPAEYRAVYEERAGRLELLVRILYGFVLGIISGVWGFVIGVLSIVQFFHILIFASRHRGIWDFQLDYTRFSARVGTYLALMTDTRPPITGREIPMSEEAPPPPPPPPS